MPTLRSSSAEGARLEQQPLGETKPAYSLAVDVRSVTRILALLYQCISVAPQLEPTSLFQPCQL